MATYPRLVRYQIPGGQEVEILLEYPPAEISDYLFRFVQHVERGGILHAVGLQFGDGGDILETTIAPLELDQTMVGKEFDIVQEWKRWREISVPVTTMEGTDDPFVGGSSITVMVSRVVSYELAYPYNAAEFFRATEAYESLDNDTAAKDARRFLEAVRRRFYSWFKMHGFAVPVEPGDESEAEKIIRIVGNAVEAGEELPTESFAAFKRWCSARGEMSERQVDYQLKKLGVYQPKGGKQGQPDSARIQDAVDELYKLYKKNNKSK